MSSYICFWHFFNTELRMVDHGTSTEKLLTDDPIMLIHRKSELISNFDQSIRKENEIEYHNLEEESTESNKQYNKIKTHIELKALQNKNSKLLKKRLTIHRNIQCNKILLKERLRELSILNLASKETSEKELSLQNQKELLSRVFSANQLKVLCGKKTHWSNDDMAVAYIIRHLGNERCYGYLMKNMNFPLPAPSSLRRWITLRKGSENK
ncbi:uncharacterized protein [Leptinotarsa decemlineata]|uniref:uncharacterized protein n=1 Tax=Leptinotarsa decemlineata TaxID=7539 RepID=UPI003D305EAC